MPIHPYAMGPTPSSLEILHEDARALAVLKPSGVTVIPDRWSASPSLRQLAQHQLGCKVYVVHRLDRGASGVVLFAKDPGAHRVLCRQFERGEVHKKYLALVQGRVAGGGEVRAALRAFGSGRMGVAGPGRTGRSSLTRYRVLERFSSATLLEVEPRTGRRHQIRVHLHHIGHPILGDTLYGRERPVGGAERLMLHALELTFIPPQPDPEPGSKALPGRLQNLTLHADPPPDFLRILQRARICTST